jgi:signal peptidase II
MSRKRIIFLSILVVGVVLDQITKAMVVKALNIGDQIPIIDGFFNLVLTYNKGAAFGLFANMSPNLSWIFFIFTTSLVMGVVAYLWWGVPDQPTLPGVGYSLVFTGAVGNLIDRVRLGEVVDFLDFHLGDFHWPAFNVADSLVCVGAGLLLWCLFKEEQSQDVSHPV